MATVIVIVAAGVIGGGVGYLIGALIVFAMLDQFREWIADWKEPTS